MRFPQEEFRLVYPVVSHYRSVTPWAGRVQNEQSDALGALPGGWILKNHDNHAVILQAVLELIAVHGFNGAPISMIAGKAGPDGCHDPEGRGSLLGHHSRKPSKTGSNGV
jgi:hypothetical protein